MHIQCPNCHCAIEIVADGTPSAGKCPSCGSQLTLDTSLPAPSEETTSYARRELRTLAHFQLVEHAGSGQHGDVWLARDTRLDRLVALKVPRNQSLDSGSVEMFLREARAAAQLRHPNIVTVHEANRDGDALYIASDFIRGLNLADWMRQHRPSPPAAAELCATIADALHHAHEEGVVHRDLKPSNIMIDAEGRPHVMDFGLAKREAGEITITVEGRILGTPAYMSPEQARGHAHQADRRSDVYSMGVMLYELLCGERPFSGEPQILLHQVLSEDPRPPRAIKPQLPRDIQTICLKAMSKDPAGRYRTAAEFAADLRRFVNGEPILARPAGRIERGWRWMRREPAMSGLAGVAVLSLLCAVVLGGMALNRPAPQDPGAKSRTAAAPVKRNVRLTTQPSGATVVFVPLSEVNGEPMGEKAIRAGTSPIDVELEPGEYLVVANLNGFGFHEVYRRVPKPGEEPTEPYSFARWKKRSSGGVGLEPIKILKNDQAVRGMTAFPGGTFTMGTSGSPLIPSHERTVAPFFMDSTEVTVSEYLRVMEVLPEGLANSAKQPSDNDAVTFVRWSAAVQFAEKMGKRLMTEAEYEFAATAGGGQNSPWGESFESIGTWQFGAVGIAGYDKTDTKPPVLGLYSNVAEWTSSWFVPYPAQRSVTQAGKLIPQSPFGPDMLRMFRAVRGGTSTVVNRESNVMRDADGARFRQGLLLDEARAGLGFRCARSATPRFLRP